jgi:hypothetical protein
MLRGASKPCHALVPGSFNGVRYGMVCPSDAGDRALRAGTHFINPRRCAAATARIRADGPGYSSRGRRAPGNQPRAGRSAGPHVAATGAGRFNIQVEQNNRPAQRLYQRASFSFAHSDHGRTSSTALPRTSPRCANLSTPRPSGQAPRRGVARRCAGKPPGDPSCRNAGDPDCTCPQRGS